MPNDLTRPANRHASPELPRQQRPGELASRDGRGDARVATAVVQDVLGNASVTGGDGALGAFTTGATALAAAGFVGTGLPGTASLAVMRTILRASQAEAEGLDTRVAAATIGRRSGSPLPDAVRSRLESAFGHDFSHVRIHADGAAADAAEALHALAFTLGRDIYFSRGAFRPSSPDGLELLAHELTHVVQADEGRLPGPSGPGLDVSSPTDSHEREAYATGEAVARAVGTSGMAAAAPSSSTDSWGGGGLAPLRNASPVASDIDSAPMQALPDTVLADVGAGPALAASPASVTAGVSGGATVSRAAAPASSQDAAKAPAKGTITLLGLPVSVNLPQAGGAPAITSTPPDIAIQGVSIRRVEVSVGKDGAIAGGVVHVNLTMGDTFLRDVRLAIGAGGVVAPTSAPLDMDVSDLGKVRVVAIIDRNGARAKGMVPPAGVPLGGVLTASESSLEVTVDGHGRASGAGLVKGTHPTLGAWTLQASWGGGGTGPAWGATRARGKPPTQPDTLTGTISFVAAPRTLAPGVQLAGGTLSGTWAGPATRLSGRGDVVVGTVLRGRVDVEGAMGDGGWSASGSLVQIGAIGGRGFVLTGASFRLDAQGGTSRLVGGGALTHADMTGTFSGTMDPTGLLLDGTATVTAPKPLDLAGRGVLRTMTGTATVEAGEIKRVRGAMIAGLNLGNVSTWYVRGADMTYDPVARSLTGEGGCALVREMTLASPKGHVLRIPGGPSCIGWVENSQVVELNGGLPCTVTDKRGELARGRSSLVWDDAGRATGAAAVTTSVRYGILDRASETLYLEPGAVGRLDIASDVLSDIVVETARLVLRSGKGSGRVDATFAGTLFPATNGADGRGTGALVEEWPVPVTWGTFAFQKGGEVEVVVTPQGLQDLSGRLAFQAVIDASRPLHVGGEYMGRFTRDGGLDGGISGVLEESLHVAAGPDEIVLEEGATVGAPIAGGALEALRVEARATYHRAGTPFLEGRVTDARYGIKEQALGFVAQLELLQDVTTPVPGGAYTATLERGSTPTITAENNAVTKIGGSFQVRVDDGEGKLYAGTLSDASVDPATWAASGTAAVATARDLDWPRATDGAIAGAPGWTMVVREGSGLAGTMTDGAMTQAMADFKVGVADPSGPLADGQLTGFVNLADDTSDLTGTVTLGREIPLRATAPEAGTVRPKGWTAAIVEGAQVGAHVTTEGLQRTSIDATAAFDHAGERIATGTLAGDYKLGDAERGFDGTATATLQKRLPWHEGTRFSTDVDVGTSLALDVAKDALGGGTGTVVLTSQLDGQDTIRAEGAVSYGTEAGLSGDTTASLLRELPMAGAGMKAGDQAVLLPSSQATAHVERDALVGVDGVLRAGLRDSAGDYLEATGMGAWTWADGGDHVDLRGRVTVLREQELGTSGAWKASLVAQGTEASADITDGTLARIDGTVGARVDRDGAPFAHVAAQGGWVPGEGVSGTGAASILVPEVHIADVGRFGLFLVEGTQAEAEVAHNAVERIGGKVPLEIRDAGQRFLRGDLDGAYVLADGTYSGGGTASVLHDHVLSDANPLKVVILKGSSAGIGITDNAVDRIGGDMQVAVHDAQGAFVAAGIRDGTWDFAGGNGFSGTGAAVISRRKQLAEVNGVSFSLDLGTGAGVEVAHDVIKRVDGAIPFVIGDAGGDLLKGDVTGEWNGATGMLGGNGTVQLTRDVAFAQGRIVLKSGSEGTGVVVDSKLVSFDGTLTVHILGETGEVVATLVGAGNYDAQSGTLVEASGKVTLLKDIPVLGADGGSRNALTVTEVSGDGKVVDNALVSVAGEVKLSFGLNGGVKGVGTITGGWARQGDRDLFHGDGHVDVAFNQDTKRGITGTGLEAHLAESGDWNVKGDVDYRLNDYIGGSLAIAIDKEWDPALTGKLEAKGNLVDAKELFSYGKTFAGVPVKIPYGTFGYGVGLELSLKTLPLTLQETFDVGPWRPLRDASSVPKIDSKLDASWGLDFHAALLPWMKVELGLGGVASVGAGIKGGVSVDDQAKAGATIGLHADGDAFWGSLGVGLEVSPTLTLSVSPFVDAKLGPLQGQKEMGPYPLAQVDLFQVRWAESFVFGESAGKRPDPVAAIQKNALKGKPAGESKNKAETQDHARKDKAGKGGDRPAVDASGIGDQKLAGAKNPLDSLVKTFDRIQKIAGAVGGMAKLVSVVITVITNLAAGPAGWLKMVWDIICGNLKFGDIQDAVKNVIEGVPVLLQELASLVPDWWERIRKFVANGPPSIINMFFGADNEAGKVIRDGETIHHAPPAMMKKLIKTAIDGDWWVAEGDERNAMLVLEACAQRGILREVVGNNASWFLKNLSGTQDKRTRYLFWKAGIPFKGDDRREDFMAANATLGGG